jgi:PPK2 family polyphosphate:nucleotide phosphotransferase
MAKLKLSKVSTTPPKSVCREEAEAEFQQLGEELFELQELLWGARSHSVLLVLQGRDTAGKDGTIKRVLGYLNPRGVDISSFGVPTEDELRHDYLWRVHQHSPAKGTVAVFNRSHYEDVLVVRVHELTAKAIWKKRYEQINEFESMLAENSTIIIKVFLHISLEEQTERLLEREQDPTKAWKLNVGDWKERGHWDAYTRAYEDAITRCDKDDAPWVVVPADKKWYRNLLVARALVKALRPYKRNWQRFLAEQGAKKKAELAAYRRKEGIKKTDLMKLIGK